MNYRATFFFAVAALTASITARSQTPVNVLETGCDAAGNCSYVVQFPDQPMLILGGSEDLVRNRTFSFSLPRLSHCWKVRTFIGLDGGDRGEFDVTVTTRSNYHFLDRSLHRYRSSSFESWWPHYVDVTGQHFNVIVLGRVVHTNDDEENGPSFGKLTARFHVGVKMQCKPVNIAPPPADNRKPTDYIPWDDRDDWARRVELSYSEWRGHRDLEGLLARPQYLKGGLRELVPMTHSELKMLMDEMFEAQQQSRTLQHKIKTVLHKDFAGRSQVRKSVANRMMNELDTWTKRYGAISAQIPQQAGCDAITCRLEKINLQ